MAKLFFRLLLLASCLLAPLAAADTSAVGLKPDLRLLIDISGSMKTSDPENLRAPALELMVRLLPEGARAGVWLFGEEVKVLVPHGEVDAHWRRRALDMIARIDNSGQRTNIPAALAAATEAVESGYRTSIVLLTDGKVDVAESPMVNANAARKLLTGTAPELGATGIPVHTIALSSEADWLFLRSLAESTQGIAEKAESAAELSAIFLQALEMVAPTARVPVAGSEFTIDDSVEEFTALVFHRGSQASPGLFDPSGQRYQPGAAGEGVSWFEAPQFTLVTVRSPQPGRWRLAVPAGAELRVAVISDLQMEVDPLPNSLPAGRQAELGLRLTDRGRAITDPEVLSALRISVVISGPGGYAEEVPVSEHYPPPADGEYRVVMPVLEHPGRYAITISLEAETLNRELPMYVEVLAPVERPTLTTRGQVPPEDDFYAPLMWLGGATALALVLTWWLLRRRKQRKMALWQKRARQAQGENGDGALVSGVSAAPEAGSERLD